MMVYPYVAICHEKATILDRFLAIRNQHVQRAYAGQGVGQVLGDGIGECEVTFK